MSQDNWRSRAAVLADRTFSETIAGMDAVAGSEAQRKQRAGEWRERLESARNREELPSWAPLEVCDLYLRSSAGVHKNQLRLLLSAPAMKKVWAQLERHRINSLSFVTAACDADWRVGKWQALVGEGRKRKSLEIAGFARALANALTETPAAFESVFRYIPDDAAETIADHCMRNPAQLISRVPFDAQDAIEDALPAGCSMRTALERLAQKADEWAASSPPFGRADASQEARAFVVRLARFIRENCDDPLLDVVGECCHILKGVYFEAAQLRKIART